MSVEPPAVIGDLADSCVRFVQDALGIELDYSPETLPILDHYVRTRAATPSHEIVALLAPAMGAYFGEVVRRSTAGVRWHTPGETYPAYRVEFASFYLCFNPIGVAIEVITRSDAGDWNAHFTMLDEARGTVDRALQANPGVAEDDYYTFSVRFEVLQQVTSLLAALEGREGNPRRNFGPDVYRAASGERDGHDLS